MLLRVSATAPRPPTSSSRCTYSNSVALQGIFPSGPTVETRPKVLYRSYLKHLRYISDPHVWSTHQPYFRALLERPPGRVIQATELSIEGTGADNEAELGPIATAEALRESRRLRGLFRAREELKKLRAAVSCHPHALRRLLDEAYGQRGRVRWELLNVRLMRQAISKSGPSPAPSSTGHPPVPAPLIPLKPAPIPPMQVKEVRLRPVPAVAIRKRAKRVAEREQRKVVVPLALPPSVEGWKTGWEDRGVVKSLRILAGLEQPQPAPLSASSPASDAGYALIPATPPCPIIEGAAAGCSSPALADSSSSPTVLSTDSEERPSPAPTSSQAVPSVPVWPAPVSIRLLPTYHHLPAHIRLLIPHKPLPPPSRDPESTYPRPRPGETRPNPRTWGPPRLLRPRLVRRSYERLWNTLRWVGQRPCQTGGRLAGQTDGMHMTGVRAVDGSVSDQDEGKEIEGREWVEDTFEAIFENGGRDIGKSRGKKGRGGKGKAGTK